MTKEGRVTPLCIGGVRRIEKSTIVWGKYMARQQVIQNWYIANRTWIMYEIKTAEICLMDEYWTSYQNGMDDTISWMYIISLIFYPSILLEQNNDE